MKTFKDNEKREWRLTVNVGTAKAVRDLTGVDLFNLYAAEAERVFSDPITFVNVLYVLCKTQCEERKMTDEDFGASLTGDSIDEAATSLLREVADFFPSSRRAVMLKMLEKSEQKAQKMEAEALAAIDRMQ